MIHDVWPLVRAETMRALDRHTIEALGVPGELLMESAGRAVVECVLAGLAPGGSVQVVCGAGNNAGDGLVVARHLHGLGVPVRVVLALGEESLRGDARANQVRAQAFGVAFQAPGARGPRPALIVDALFGTGLSRPVEGAAATAIRRINAAREACRIVAIDLPSGLDADTGQVLGEAVHAHQTVTLGLPKLGLALEPGRSLAGEVRVARIGIADEAPDGTPDAELWTRAAAGARLPERPRDGHKGRFGHVLVVAGSVGKSGAAALAAHGALRVGAGLATLACPQSLNEILEVKCTEAMTAPVAETAERALALEAEGALLALAAERDVVVLGPGIGRAEDTGKLVRALVESIDKPLVLDADALFALANAPEWLQRRRAPTVLTPHPGEAARLAGSAADAVNRDRVGFAQALAARTGAVVLLKGAASVVAGGGGCPLVNPSGGPALASGGTGDVLAGMVAGFLAQGRPAREAAALGAFLHGHAADRIAARRSEVGLLADELAAELPAAAESLRQAARPARGAGLGDRLALAFPEP